MAPTVVAVHHIALTVVEYDARARTQQIASRRERRERGGRGETSLAALVAISRLTRARGDAERPRRDRSSSASFDVVRTSRPMAAPIGRATRWKFGLGDTKERRIDSRADLASRS